MKGILDIHLISEISGHLDGLFRKVHTWINTITDFVGETEFLFNHHFLLRYRIKPALSYSGIGFVHL